MSELHNQLPRIAALALLVFFALLMTLALTLQDVEGQISVVPTYTITPTSTSTPAPTSTPTSTSTPAPTSTPTSTSTPRTPPQQAAEDIIAAVQEIGLPYEQEVELTEPLQNLIAVLDDDNPKNDKAACNNLRSFKNEVAGLEKDGTLTTEEADTLRKAADDIASGLGCRWLTRKV